MADNIMDRRTLLRAALVLALVATAVVGGFPPAESSPFPKTEMRTVAVTARALVPRRSPSIAVVGGVVRALEPAHTAPVRVCAPIWFTAVGLTWDQPRGGVPETNVSTSADGSSFGHVANLDTESAPDPGTDEFRRAREGSELLWTGGARCARFRIDMPAGAAISNLRVHFINSSGTTGGPATGAPNTGPLAPSAPTGFFAPAGAQAAPPQPNFISREQWGADESLINCTPGVAPAVKMAFVHHTAGSNDYSRPEADDVIRGVYAYHTNGRGYCDIAYNMLIDRFGRPYEGRSGGLDVPVISGATQGFNTGSASVSVMGNFETARVPAKVRATLQRVLAWRLDVAHVRPTGRATMVSAGGNNTQYPEGAVVKLPAVSGHRHTGFTACPGDMLFRLLPGIRSTAEGIGLPKLYHPTLSPTEVVTGVGQNIRIKAQGSEAFDWTVTVLDALGATIAALPPQTGESLNLLWTSSGTPAQPTVVGAYRVVIAGQTSGGEIAREASLTLTVAPPAPSPSPSPSPSTSPSPSASPTP